MRSRLPAPLCGHYSLTPSTRVPILPALWCTALLDGSLVVRLVFGFTSSGAAHRAVRMALRDGREVARLRGVA